MDYNKEGVDPDATDAYFTWLQRWAWKHSDGCTGVVDWYVHCCWAHDFGYQTGFDPFQWYKGQSIVQSFSDTNTKLRHCIQCESKLGRLNPVSWVRWVGVTAFGRLFWHPKPAETP